MEDTKPECYWQELKEVCDLNAFSDSKQVDEVLVLEGVSDKQKSEILMNRCKHVGKMVNLAAETAKAAISDDIAKMEQDLGKVLSACKRVDDSLQLEQDLYELDEVMRGLQKQLGQLMSIVQIHREKNVRSRERLSGMRMNGPYTRF